MKFFQQKLFFNLLLRPQKLLNKVSDKAKQRVFTMQPGTHFKWRHKDLIKLHNYSQQRLFLSFVHLMDLKHGLKKKKIKSNVTKLTACEIKNLKRKNCVLWNIGIVFHIHMPVSPQKIKIFGPGNQKLDLLHLDFQSLLKKEVFVNALGFPYNLIGKII